MYVCLIKTLKENGSCTLRGGLRESKTMVGRNVEKQQQILNSRSYGGGCGRVKEEIKKQFELLSLGQGQ